MMNRPQILTGRIPHPPGRLAVFVDLQGAFLGADVVHRVHGGDVQGLGEHFVVLVVTPRVIVGDAPLERFAGVALGPCLMPCAVMCKPAGGHGADAGVAVPVPEPLLQGLGVAHFDEFVGVEEAHPGVHVLVGFYAFFLVHVVLDLFGPVGAGDVAVCDCAGRDAVVVGGFGGQGGEGAVVDEVEAPDAVVVVVVFEPFG